MNERLVNFIIAQMESKAHKPTTTTHAQWVEDCVEYVRKLLNTDDELNIETYCEMLITRYCESVNLMYRMNMIMFSELYFGTFAYAEGIGALK